MMRLIQASLVLALLTGCHTQAPMIVTRPASKATTQNTNVILTGRVQFPGYRVQVTPSQIASQAVVSLLNASGDTVAAGVTDSQGNFTLYQSTTAFLATDTAFYDLEVMKQVPGQGGWASLRTKLQSTSGTWDSISGSTIVINDKTTAICQLAAEDNVTDNSIIMGVLSGSTVTPFDIYDQTDVDNRAATITQNLADGEDPMGTAWQQLQ